MVRVKFKVGDKVKILPSAVLWNVPKSEVGKFGVLVQHFSSKDLYVYMDKPWPEYNTREKWVVHFSHIEIAVKPGQQLEFAFMQTSG